MNDNDLVMLRLPFDLKSKVRQRHYNTWFRVRFIDTDNTFIGECERVNENVFTPYKVGEHIRLDVDKVLSVYKEGEQFCYSDNITICDCKGLCKNK